jgi:hypothetical protein
MLFFSFISYNSYKLKKIQKFFEKLSYFTYRNMTKLELVNYLNCAF